MAITGTIFAATILMGCNPLVPLLVTKLGALEFAVCYTLIVVTGTEIAEMTARIVVDNLYPMSDSDIENKESEKSEGNGDIENKEILVGENGKLFDSDSDMEFGDLSRISYKFDSNIIPTEMLDFGTKRLLEVDRRIIVPMNMPLRFVITSGDVLHA